MRVITILALVAVASIVGCDSPSRSSADEIVIDGKPEQPLHVADLNERAVIGRLGVPLGTAVEIRAEIISGHSLRLKAYASRYLLKVTHVSGKALQDPPTLEFEVPGFIDANVASDHFELAELKRGERVGRLSGAEIKELEKGYVGEVVRLGVYEGGMFDGIPKNRLPGVPIWADRIYHFTTYLVVVAQR